MEPTENREVILRERPADIPRAEHFEIVTVEAPEVREGQVLVRNRFLSVDPAMRGWVSTAANYSEPVGLGEVMRSFAVGEVVESRHERYEVGQVVMGMFGWRELAAVDPRQASACLKGLRARGGSDCDRRHQSAERRPR